MLRSGFILDGRTTHYEFGCIERSWYHMLFLGVIEYDIGTFCFNSFSCWRRGLHYNSNRNLVSECSLLFSAAEHAEATLHLQTGNNRGREFWVQLTRHSARYLIRHYTWENTQSPVRTRVTHRRTMSLGHVGTTSLCRESVHCVASVMEGQCVQHGHVGNKLALSISYLLKTELVLCATKGSCCGMKFYGPDCPVIYR